MKPRTKIGLLAVAVCLAFTAAIPVLAAESDKTFAVDITPVEEDLSIGEAQFKVSVSGAEGATIAQLAFEFEGNLKYDDVMFLIGENNPPEYAHIFPSEENANRKKAFSLSVVGDIEFSDNQELFIISFSGDAGKDVTLTAKNDTGSYCEIGSEKIFLSDSVSETLTGSETGTESTPAAILLTLDKISGFTTKNDPGFTVTLTRDDGFTSSIAVSNGHRKVTSDTTAVFEITKSVLKGRAYTVGLLGVGYIPYEKTGVTFDKALEITNADFVPGDVNGDKNVNAEDKKIVQELIDNMEYESYADFNRDGSVDDLDMRIYAGIEDETEGGEGEGDGDGGGSSSGSSSSGSSDSGESSSGNSSGSSSGSSSGGSSGGGFGGGTTAKPSNGEVFTDLANYAWAKNYIYTLKNKGIINGISDTEFAPQNNIKRGDFMLILTKMLGISDAFTESFADVPEGAYYYSAIGSARAAGIASGDGDNFMPEASITRQDLITLAYRAFLNKGYITEADDLSVLDAFSDKDDISDYAKGAMAAMVKAGIIQGSDGMVNPKGNATRAEVAVMCARMLELMK